MLKIEIQKQDTLFEQAYLCTWSNEVSGKRDNHGEFSAKNLDLIFNKLKKIAIQQVSTSIRSIVKERRFIYTNLWRPESQYMANVKQSYIDRLDLLERYAKAILSQDYDTTAPMIIKLCDSILKEIIPAPGKAKHEDIKTKVEKIKSFFSAFHRFSALDNLNSFNTLLQ
jgi:hypothetical protein